MVKNEQKEIAGGVGGCSAGLYGGCVQYTDDVEKVCKYVNDGAILVEEWCNKVIATNFY